MFPDLTTYTTEEKRIWIHLRALEWSAWPTYISQPLVPVLFTIFPWQAVLIWVVAADFVWQFFQYAFVSLVLSELSSTVVILVKWPAAVVGAIVLIVQGKYVLAALAVLWTFFASVITAPFHLLLGKLRLRRSLVSIEAALGASLGSRTQL